MAKTQKLIDKYKEKKEKERLKALEEGNIEKADESIEEKQADTVNELSAEDNMQENTAEETQVQENQEQEKQEQPVQMEDNNTQSVPAAPEEMN